MGETYSDDEVETIKRRWAEGASAAVIGDEIGRSRNSVLGRLYRMGLGREKSDKPTTESKPRPQRVHAFRPNPKEPNIVGGKRSAVSFLFSPNASNERKAPTIPPPDAPPSAIDSPVGVLGEQGVPITGLTNSTCRWPLWGWHERSGFYCGVPEADLAENRAYCPEHARMACSLSQRI